MSACDCSGWSKNASTAGAPLDVAKSSSDSGKIGAESDQLIGNDFAAAGITGDGLRILSALEKRLGSVKLSPLHAAINELRTYVGLLHTAAAGESVSLSAFRDLVLSVPLPDGPLLGRMPADIPGSPLPGRMPAGIPGSPLPGRGPQYPADYGPCGGLSPPHPFVFLGAGLNMAGGFGVAAGLDGTLGMNLNFRPSAPVVFPDASGWGDAFIWIDRAYAAWATRAGGVESVLGAGARYLSSGNPKELFDSLGALLSWGDLVPGKQFQFPCFDEYQVCISEFVFTAMGLAKTLAMSPFLQLGSISPIDQCLGTAVPLSIYPPAGKQFPPQLTIQSGSFLSIDRQPAKVLVWSPQRITLELPAGITAGCHSVGWVHLFSPGAVIQLSAIGEQCRPWFGGDLSGAPYAVAEDQGHFSLIGAPSVDTFHGPGGSIAPNAEGCTPVTLTWATSLPSCPGSSAQQVTIMLRDGQLYKAALPASGQLVVVDAADRTYTLRTQARVGNQLCGISEKTLTLSRFFKVIAQALGPNGIRGGPSDTDCIEPGVGITIGVKVSCPAPVGGLPVTITSPIPTRVPGANAMIAEGTDTTAVEVLAGNECGSVNLTVSVPKHSSADVYVTVSSTPVISGITPMSFHTCDQISLTVNGTCLGEHADDIDAWVEVNGQPLAGVVTVITSSTKIRVDLPPLPAGSHTFAVRYCSHSTYAATPIIVTTPAPHINSPLSANVLALELCTAPSVTLRWGVSGATRVTLMRSGISIADRTYPDACASVSDSVTDNLPLVSAPVTYTLSAFNADGAMVTSTRPLPISAALPVASAIVAHNGYSRAVNLFLIYAESPTGGAFVGTVASGAFVSVPIPDCKVRGIIAIDPVEVANHNANFRDNLSATSAELARTNGPWTRSPSPWYLGLASANPVGTIEI